MPNSTEFTLEPNPLRVIRSIRIALPGCTALRARIVVVVMEITGSVIEPASYRIDQSRRVNRANGIGDVELGIIAAVTYLAPALVVDHPGDDAWVVLELLYHDAELPLELGLLDGCGHIVRLAGGGAHGGHVLDDEQTELVTGMVVELGFNFYLGKGDTGECLSELCRGGQNLHVSEPCSFPGS